MKRIIYGSFRHETNSFSPMKADMEAYRSSSFLWGDEIPASLIGVKNSLSGFLSVVEGKEDIETVPVMNLSTSPCAPVTSDVFDMALSEFCRAYKEKGPFDAIYLHLHGAMVAEGHDDGEGDFLEGIRKVTGFGIPVFVTLDLHANITEKMAKNADTLVTCKYYPHTDFYDIGELTGKMILAYFEGSFKPCLAFRHIPYLLPLFPTAFPEIKRFIDEADEFEEEDGVWAARIGHGFFPANVPIMGMSTLCVTNGDQEKAERIAQKLCDDIIANLDSLKIDYPDLDVALDMVNEDLGGPLVLADSSDNPGAGGPGDTTHIVRRILERGITGAAVAMISDPAAVQECIKAGVGNDVEVYVGGKNDLRLSGGPVLLKGHVKSICDGLYRNQDEVDRGSLVNMGITVTLETAGNYILLTTNRRAPEDAEIFRSCGIAPERQRILVVKSSVHFRASFGKFAGRIVVLAVPGYCAPDPKVFRSLGFDLKDAQ